jgi:hypothetical protein
VCTWSLIGGSAEHGAGQGVSTSGGARAWRLDEQGKAPTGTTRLRRGGELQRGGWARRDGEREESLSEWRGEKQGHGLTFYRGRGGEERPRRPGRGRDGRRSPSLDP